MIEMLIASFLTIHTPAYADYEMTQGQWDEFNRAMNLIVSQRMYITRQEINHYDGQMAVISVTINRVNDDRFPNTICECCQRRYDQSHIVLVGKELVK